MDCPFPGNNITVKRHGFLLALVFLLLTPLMTHGQTTNSRTFSGTGTSITATGNSLNTNITNGSIAVTGSVTVSGTVAATQSGTWTVQPGNTANTTAWKVDGSAVVQPISGTVSITANSAVNVAQVAGTNTDTNSGLKSAGTLRVVLATDQPALTNKLLVTPDSVALPANQSVNVAQVSGATPSATNPLNVIETDGTAAYSSDVIGANRYRKVSAVQDIELSAGNSSTANLAAGASFTGTSNTTLGVGAIQVNLFTDQNATIQVQQAQEDPGTNWNIIDSWTYTANSTGTDAARTIQATGASTRIVVTNTGAATTTVLRLATAMCPVCDSLPRGLTQLGNMKTAVVESLPAGTNTLGTVKIDPASNTDAYGSGFVDKKTQRVELALNSQGQVRLAQGSQTVGAVLGTQADNTFNGTQKIPVLPARANQTAPLVTENYQQPLSTTLFGASREALTDPYGNPVGVPGNPLTVTLQTAALLTPSPTTLGKPSGLTTTNTTVAVLANQGALRGPTGAIKGDYGMVTHPSVAPALQCPYVKPINVTAATELVTNAGGQRIHVCAFSVVLAGAESVSLVEGTGTLCGTGTTGLYGGTSASAAFAANGGVAMTSDRITLPMQVAGDNLCLLKSAANNVSGTLVYGLY